MAETIDCHLIDARLCSLFAQRARPVESENMARFLMTDYDYTQHETLTLKNVLIYYKFLYVEGNYSQKSEAMKGNSKGSVGLPSEQTRPRIAWYISI